MAIWSTVMIVAITTLGAYFAGAISETTAVGIAGTGIAAIAALTGKETKV